MPAVYIKNKRSIASILKIALIPVINGFAKYAWRSIPRSAYLGASPIRLNLAITRKCNANCVFCAYQFARKEDTVHMSDAIFKLALQRMRHARIRQVMMSPNIGEPLMAPMFMDKLSQLRAIGVDQIEVTTNGLLLHRTDARKFLLNGPDKINLSFAGFDQAMYERDYRVRHFERTRDSILKLLRENRLLGNKREINIRLRGDLPVDVLLAAPEMEEVMQLAHSVEVMTEVDDWLGLITKDILPEGYILQKEAPELTLRPCMLLWDLTVHPDGDIHLCACRNVYGDPRLHIGNIKEMDLVEAHGKIGDILDEWESGNVPTTCKTCSMYCDPANGLIGRRREIRQDAALKS